MNKEQILGIIRHTLTFVGGIIIAQGIASESLTTDLIGGIITVVGTIWSIVSKKTA
jgi:formylmethanofuran dehydrogenase subunit C